MHVVRTLTNKVLGCKTHTDIFVTRSWSHFHLGDERPFQNFSAWTLLADRLGQYAIGDKPLRKQWTLQALALLRATGTVHVVTMPAIAGTGFEPVASRL